MRRAAATKVARGLLQSLVLGAAMAAALALSSTVAEDGHNTMAVIPADSGAVAVGGSFTVGIHVTGAELAYTVVGAQLEWDAAALEWVSDNSTGSILGFPQPPVFRSGDPPGSEQLDGMGGIVGSSPLQTTGLVWTVTLRCDQPGTYALHLVSTAEDPLLGTATAAVAGSPQPMVLQDSQVTCQGEGVPAPTATPGAAVTPTATPGGGASPAPTPAVPMATATPLPPGLEAVSLAAGCNPVTSTYPNGTPIQTIAGAVGPEGNLVSLWRLDAGTWQAFSPRYPEDSDLVQADFLDVVFACVGGSGAFVRPEA